MIAHFQRTHTLRQRVRRIGIILIILLLSSLTILRTRAHEGEQNTAAEHVLETLQTAFADSDEYRFTAQIEQTLIPLATAANIGKSEERIDSQLLGQITPEKNVLDWRFEGNRMPKLLLEQEGGNTYFIQNGERTLIENPLSASAPDGSFAGYLHAATNLVERYDPDFPSYTIYQFDLDGKAFANYLIEQVQAS